MDIITGNEIHSVESQAHFGEVHSGGWKDFQVIRWLCVLLILVPRMSEYSKASLSQEFLNFFNAYLGKPFCQCHLPDMCLVSGVPGLVVGVKS